MPQSFRIDNEHSIDEMVSRALTRVMHNVNDDIKWTVEHDRVCLTGVVSSYYEKQIAQEALLQMPELGTVLNHLQVEKTMK
ncbi:MAG: BON domain-containing protein [Planctomycetaceae bacterium]|nr:BON domain-containing protein [Planctomycetaceae bacterium]